MADTILYEASLKKFDDKVEKYGREKMAAKLTELRSKRLRLLDRCTVERKPFPASELKDTHHAIVSPPGIIIGGWKLKTDEDKYFCGVGNRSSVPLFFM